MVIVAISVFPSVLVFVGAALAAKAKAGEIAMVAAAAPAESSALRRVMEEKISVISYPAIVSFQASDDALARLMTGNCHGSRCANNCTNIFDSIALFATMGRKEGFRMNGDERLFWSVTSRSRVDPASR
ncbi:hypothetical protein [Rhizobium sp. 16-449-1b]|uniref:hypothetical protein n=1 Tax=Rhizobium sp. 16-449-1b TaxID=2819989 RepID=UPI0032AED2DD